MKRKIYVENVSHWLSDCTPQQDNARGSASAKLPWLDGKLGTSTRRPEIQRGISAHLEQVGLFLPFICTLEELLGEESVE